MCRHAYFAHDFHPQANNKINNRAQDFLNYLELRILRAPHLQTPSPHQPRDPKAEKKVDESPIFVSIQLPHSPCAPPKKTTSNLHQLLLHAGPLGSILAF